MEGQTSSFALAVASNSNSARAHKAQRFILKHREKESLGREISGFFITEGKRDRGSITMKYEKMRSIFWSRKRPRMRETVALSIIKH